MVSEETASMMRSRRTLEYLGGEIRTTMRRRPKTAMALSLKNEECLSVCLSVCPWYKSVENDPRDV